MNFLLLSSIFYLIFYYILILFYNIFIIDYIYPYATSIIDRSVNSCIDYFNNYDLNNDLYNNSYNNIYSYHYYYKKNINKNKLFKNKNLFLLTFLTCPICYNIFDKIYVCQNGHSVCNNCFSNSNICSFCRIDINKNTRNRVLEDLLDNFKLPCSFYNYGCNKLLFNNIRHKHELKCIHQPLKCCFNNCVFHSNYTDLKKHIHEQHHFYDFITPSSDVYSVSNFIFNISHFIDFNNLSDKYNIFKIIDIDNNIIFVNFFIQTNQLNNNSSSDINNLYLNKALCFSLLGTRSNKFSINIYNSNSFSPINGDFKSNKFNNKFGKYTLFNKINKNICYNNTICIPLASVFNIKDSSFNIDIIVYNSFNNNIKFDNKKIVPFSQT